MEKQTFLSYLGFIFIIIMYALLLYVWSNAKKHLTPVIRNTIFVGIIYIGSLKSMDFANGLNLFDRYLIVHLFLASLIYFILIGFRFHNKVSYAWRITKLKNVFKWERCKVSFGLMRQIIKEKQMQQKIAATNTKCCTKNCDKC